MQTEVWAGENLKSELRYENDRITVKCGGVVLKKMATEVAWARVSFKVTHAQ